MGVALGQRDKSYSDTFCLDNLLALIIGIAEYADKK
jgi:hypothetical protein